jgi:hypothetical protein
MTPLLIVVDADTKVRELNSALFMDYLPREITFEQTLESDFKFFEFPSQFDSH